MGSRKRVLAGRGRAVVALVAAALVVVGMARPAHAVDWVDPLGFTPLELTGRFGVLWMGAATAASLLLTQAPPGQGRAPLVIVGDTGWVGADNEAETDLWLQRLRPSWFVRPWMDVAFELHGFGARDAVARPMGGGASASVRWLALPHRRIQPYFHYSVGGALTTEPFPPGGTVFNFLHNYAVGLRTPFVHPDVRSRLELRFLHLSNGRGLGPDNPAIRAVGFSVGFEIAVPREEKPAD